MGEGALRLLAAMAAIVIAVVACDNLFWLETGGRWLLLAVVGAFTALGLSSWVVFRWLEDRRDPIVSLETRLRLEKRTLAHPDRARKDQLEALKKAWGLVKANPAWVASDGKVIGSPLELARESLDYGLYKTDESFAFDLWAFPRNNPRGMVLYYKRALAHEVVWVATDDKGHSVRPGDELSDELLDKIRALYGK